MSKPKEMIDPKRVILEKYRQQKWLEPMIYDLGTPGERGIVAVELEPEIREAMGDAAALVPAGMLRKTPPHLPEVAQPRVMKHYTRLSQETSSEDSHIMFPLGTCTLKHNPKSHERIAEIPQFSELHPRQDESTVQGILEIMCKFENYLKAISGLDAVSLQPACGSQGVFTNARIIRAYQEERGFGLDKKDEIITTLFSHPSNPATPAMSGYKVITLYPDENGYPSMEKFEAAINERTAGLIIGCPDDTGIFNPNVQKITQAVHDAGGLCVLDSANANGYFGWARAKESGFDMTHWNLHKSFATPHGGAGPGSGSVAVRKDLEKYLPVPAVRFDGERYSLAYDKPSSIGKVRPFYGNIGVVLRAFTWVTSLGPAGMKEVTQTAVLNNNYLKSLLETIPGVKMAYSMPNRLHEIRWDFTEVCEANDIHFTQLIARITDYGIGDTFPSHYPYIVEHPLTPEPTETYSKEEIEEYAAVVRKVVDECYKTPDVVRTAPHNAAMPYVPMEIKYDPSIIAPCRTMWLKVHGPA